MSPKGIATKKTIYVDVDEEITGIIDKVRSTNEQIIAMVVPKRAAVFASVVNLKLLKRAADQSKKRVVLITSNQSVLPLAGVVGMHVAPSLNSKPYIPKAPDMPDTTETPAEDEAIEIDTVAAAAATAAVVAKKTADEKANDSDTAQATEEEIPTIPVENGTTDTKKSSSNAKKGSTKSGKKQKFNVPNFNRFRKLLIIGAIALIVLAVGGYWAFAMAPNATVYLTGENKDASLSFEVQADTSATELNEEGAVVPSTTKVIKKTETEKVPATGQKDTGNKASGTMELQNCSQSDGSVNIPAGTAVTSGDLTFLTQEAVFLDTSIFTGGGRCVSDTKEVEVIAKEGGEKYNVGEKQYTVSGFSGVKASGSAMTGGTTNIVKVVTAEDVENAKQKLTEKTAGSTEELKAALNAEGYIPVPDTFSATAGAYVPTPAVDSEGSEVAVTVENTYSMLGIKKSDLQQMVKVKAEKDGGIDTSKQSILDDGLSKASYQIVGNNGSVTAVKVNTNVVAGPQFNQDEIKTEVAGKKRGEAEQLLNDRPGVKSVRIETKPFWNYGVPKKTGKITIVIEGTDAPAANP